MIDTAALQQFAHKYNKFSGRTSTDNFLFFYSSILSYFTTDRALVNDVLSVLRTLIKRIRIVDDLVDLDKLELSLAFPLVFPEFRQQTESPVASESLDVKQLYESDLTKSYVLEDECETIIKKRFNSLNTVS